MVRRAGASRSLTSHSPTSPLLTRERGMTAIPTDTLVTVFGGSGFLGRHVVRALAKRGYRIRVAVRRPDLAGHPQPLGRVAQVHAVQANPLYARSKATGEKLVLAAMPSATILRPSVVFGPEDDFFNKFAAMARIAPALPLVGGGETRFQPVFAGDVAAAVLAAVEGRAAAGQIYELGGPDGKSF